MANWDEKYNTVTYVLGKQPVAWLERHAHLLPDTGRALDVAAGEGRNAVFLASLGLEVDAVDQSAVGLKKAKALATEQGVSIHTVVANLEGYDPGTACYDVVVNFFYLQRSLIPKIKQALKEGGLILFETYTVEHLELPSTRGPRTRAYLLERGELEALFDDFEILHASESKDAQRAVASLVARKPS